MGLTPTLAPSPSSMVLGFLCKRKPFTYNHQGLKCCGVGPRGLYETKCRMEVSGTPTVRLMHQSLGALPPSLLRARLASGEPGTLILPFCLCSSFLPPIRHSLAPSPFLEASSPLPPRGPLSPPARAHPFPVPPQLRLHSRWKVSLKMGGSFFLPGGPRKPKTSGEVRGGLSGLWQEGK